LLLARNGVQREQRNPRLPGFQKYQVKPAIPTRHHNEVIGNVGVFDEELAAVQSPSHLSRDGDSIRNKIRTCLGHGQGAQPFATRQRGQQAFLLGPAAGAKEERGGDHGALDIGARKAEPPHLFYKQNDIE
jgi:hypothetical protein